MASAADTISTDFQLRPHPLFLHFMHNLNDNSVINECNSHADGPFQRITTQNDTVLHLASRVQNVELVLKLLGIVQGRNWNDRLSSATNKIGNSILHELAASDSMEAVVEEMLKRAPALLTARNHFGETPIFYAARYGQAAMFEFLAEEMKRSGQTEVAGRHCLKRDDGTTALHISIYTENFGLALHIAEGYSDLIEEKDRDSMTALQHLACNPTAFEKNKIKGHHDFMKELMLPEETTSQAGPPPPIWIFLFQMLREPFRFSSMYKLSFYLITICLYSVLKKSNERNEPLRELVQLLVEKDTSWYTEINYREEVGKETASVREQNHPDTSISNQDKKSNEAALLLATASNNQYLVEEIIKYHPEALMLTNKEGMNILHLTILHRHMEIFDFVMKQNNILVRSLLSASDCKGNSLIHMVGLKRNSQSSEKMQTPAFQLQRELKLLKKVKSACTEHITRRVNNDNQTAEELFAVRNESLQRDAKEWLMRTTENCTILSVFIATVAFAAAYTVPGGPDQNTGIPILNSKPFFVMFLVADVLSLTLALTSVGIFLSILTSSFPLEDFETYLFQKLKRGMMTMIFSISMMAVSFGATIVLIWKNAAWSAVGFLPVPLFFLSYSPLRSAAKEFCTKALTNFAIKLFACMLTVIFVGYVFFYWLFYLLFMALRCIISTPIKLLYKVCNRIACKPFRWIRGNKSKAKPYTQDPDPASTAAPDKPDV